MTNELRQENQVDSCFKILYNECCSKVVDRILRYFCLLKVSIDCCPNVPDCQWFTVFADKDIRRVCFWSFFEVVVECFLCWGVEGDLSGGLSCVGFDGDLVFLGVLEFEVSNFGDP